MSTATAHRLLPRSLTSRLVITAVALVALVGVLVATSATLAMRSYLYSQLDDKVGDAVRRAAGPGDPESSATAGPYQPGEIIVGSVAGTPQYVGFTVSETSRFGKDPLQPLSTADVRKIAALPASDETRTVHAGGRSYRVRVAADGTGQVLVVGLPTDDIDHTLGNMITWFALLTLLGVVLAAGGGTWVVRRQLRPLRAVADAAREVTTQDLSTGDAGIATRVPEQLTDPDTEVGQVGSALNTLLDHVEDALGARHRSEQQVRQFVADASHELRTPLSTIHGYAELSRRTPEDPQALGLALGKVETEAGRMSGLVEDLLLLARLDAGRPLAREDVDLTHLLLEAVADARVVAPEHQWRLSLPEDPVTLTGDPARLHQVITNLLGNARSHTPAGTTVTVGAGADRDEVRLTVHDDGPGLAPELAAEAFERFTRGDSSRTRSSGGAGLGLSLVSAIAQAHAGTATVVSEPGDTTFTVTLPRSGARTGSSSEAGSRARAEDR